MTTCVGCGHPMIDHHSHSDSVKVQINCTACECEEIRWHEFRD